MFSLLNNQATAWRQPRPLGMLRSSATLAWEMNGNQKSEWRAGHSLDQMAYALRGGLVVHISQVQRGLACGCVCSACQKPLLARKGAVRTHHFAHATRSDCPGPAETLLHRAAKEMVATLTEIRLPAYTRCRSRREALWMESPTGKLILREVSEHIESAKIETPIASIIPDVILTIKAKQLAVEIVVTHDVDTRKMRVYRNHDVPVIRISLGWQDQWLAPEELRQKLAQDLTCKAWLFHPKQRAHEAKWYQARRDERRLERRRRREAVHFINSSHARESPAMTLVQQFQQQVQRERVVLQDPLRWAHFDAWAIAVMQSSGRYPTYEDYKAAGEDPWLRG